jgi:effector-binding domain-containing protein/carbon monoxide dehydrogenase subunit G
MKILKRILLVLLILIVLVIIIGFMFPAKVRIERSIVVNAKPETVFSEINSMKNFNTWSPFYELDTTAKYTYEGPDAGVGNKVSWESTNKNVGSGSMTITESKPNESVTTTLDFKQEGQATSNLKLENADNGTKVTWAFEMDAGMNPVARLMGAIMGSSMLGPMYEKGLNKLRTVVESKPPVAQKEIKIEATTVTETHYLAVRDTVSVFSISSKLGLFYHQVGEVMKKQKLNMAGAPFAIYYTESKTNWDMDAAIPTDKPGKADGIVKPGTIKSGHAVVAHYFGDYMKVSAAYEALHKWIAQNDKKIIGAPWEVYMNDPGIETDTAKWQTDVYFPVQ